MLNKDQLVFDPTAANNDDHDVVGAHLLDGVGNAVTSTDVGGGVQALDVNVAGGTLTVDLDFATDQVDASGSVIALDATTLAALENVTVSATDLDIRDLSAATDSVSIVDTNAACAHSAVSITTTATNIVASPLANRTILHIQNLGNRAIYVGCDNSVTTATGTRIPRGGSAEFKFSDAVSMHAITDAGTADVRVIEHATS